MAKKTNISIAATLRDAEDDRVMARATVEYFELDPEQTLAMEDVWVVGPFNQAHAYGESIASSTANAGQAQVG